MTKPVALFDLDGTLCDFNTAMAQYMVRLASPLEPPVDYAMYDQENESQWMRERRRLIKNQPGFWSSLHPLPLGMRLLSLAMDLCRVVIFTKAPLKQPIAFTEKAQWCARHIVGQYDLSIVTDKGLHYGRLLVDDWPSYITKWLEHRPRGHVIMPAHPYNAGFVHPQVTRVGLENIDDGFRVIEAVADQRSARPVDSKDNT
mgnify:CR=1 FL=1